MTPAEALLVVLRDGHTMLQTVMRDVSSELARRQPPAGANSIGSIYAHAVGVEDLYIQQIIQGKPMVWETGGWAATLGHATSPNLWDREAPPPDLDAFLAYRRAVYSASELYIAGLTPDVLDEALKFPGRDWSMTRMQLLALVFSHGTGHAGEIAAIKGMLGLQGLPY